MPEETRYRALAIYDFEGELFFGAAPELHKYFDCIRRETTSESIETQELYGALRTG